MSEQRWQSLRKEYMLAGLDEAHALADPIVQLEAWLHQAQDAGVPEPNAMILATSTPTGEPNARVVLLKGLDERGLVFYTNYESAKGLELLVNPKAAVVFVWLSLERQVRVQGDVERVSREESADYFGTRPRGSQLGAWASPQSQRVPGRSALDARLSEMEARFGQGEVPLPPAWGGYRLAPRSFEFWQGRPNRMHDRLSYVREGTSYRIERLAP